MAPSAHLVIGIDGGGTKTIAWLAPLEEARTRGASTPHWLGRGIAGPGNPRAVGFDVAQANIDAAIAAAFEDAKLTRQTVAAACFGLAGCGRAEEQEQMTTWADTHGIAYMVKVTGDAEPILAAASSDNVGIALICGTGSLAWGRNERGETARSGGWGYLIGDEGSGYAIALAGLRAAVQSADGRKPTTVLLPRFQEQLAADTPDELIGRIYGLEMTRERLAALVSTVFTAAELNDAAATDIVASAVSALADMLQTLVRRLSLQAGNYPLALAGGVLLHQSDYRQRLLEELSRRGAEPATIVLVPDPAAGAVALARQLARI